jgi:hypothetical protein
VSVPCQGREPPTFRGSCVLQRYGTVRNSPPPRDTLSSLVRGCADGLSKRGKQRTTILGPNVLR